MEKYFDRDEVRMTFKFNDKTSLLENISIEIRDSDFFPKPELHDVKFKPEISGWLDAMQQTIFGFMRQAPRVVEKKSPPAVEPGSGAFNAAPPPELAPPTQFESNTIKKDPEVVRAVCPKCNSQIPLLRTCCGGGGEPVYKGNCPNCNQPVKLPLKAVQRK